jgi:sortase A
VAGSLRSRPVPRALIGTLSVLMIVGGVALFAWPFVTNLLSDFRQGDLRRGFGSPAHREAYVTRTLKPGDALTRIMIPALDVDTIVVEGTTLQALQAGSGHYQGTSLPCEEGNAAIAGHRTTYGKPFANIGSLAEGDRIVLVTPVGRCVYRVAGSPWLTHPEDFSVLKQVDGSVLTLTTCHPPGESDQRLIVRAELVRNEALPA